MGKVPSVPSGLVMEGLDRMSSLHLPPVLLQALLCCTSSLLLGRQLALSQPCWGIHSPIGIQPPKTCHLHQQSPRSTSYLRPFLVLWF